MAAPPGQTASANWQVARSVSAAHHVDAVAAVVHGECSQSESSSIEVEAVSSSWRRSAQAHHVNPESRESPRILTESSLRSSIEPIENVVLAAQTELDRLHRMVGQAGYVTPASLLAVDRDHRVVGADRNARAEYRVDPQSMDAGVSVWAIFSRKGLLLRKGVPTDYPVRLTTVRGGDCFFALVSGPVTTSRLHVGKLEATLLMQPRIDLLEDLSWRFTIQPPRGGLAPGALRRVVEYVDSHLCEDLALETLAAHTGLSTYHFARAFKQSVDMPPHRYLLQQRVKRATELLKQTEQPLTAIAQSLGFADQSHFSRSFHWFAGLAPSEFRRSHR